MNSRLTDIKTYLTYSYENYDKRELIYQKVIDSLFKNLTPDSRKLDTKQYQWAQELELYGSCEVDNMSYELLTSIQNLISPSNEVLLSSGKYIIPDQTVYYDSNILKSASNPDIIRAIQAYLGVFPSIQYISMWSNYGSTMKRTNEMYWHFDHHGHKFIKLFFYLNDTRNGFGHHEYINQTHKQNLFDKEMSSQAYFLNLKNSIALKRLHKGKFKIDDDVILPLNSRVKRFTGQHGFAFMEDTRGLHKGTLLPNESFRHILQILYVPFDNGKDIKPKINLNQAILSEIMQEFNFNKSEIRKLFCLLC